MSKVHNFIDIMSICPEKLIPLHKNKHGYRSY